MNQARSSDGGCTRTVLSIGQEQLYFLEQMLPGRPTYNVPLIHRVTGPLDIEALRKSLAATVRRHESLRTSFRSADGTPYGCVTPAADAELPVTDFSALPAQDRETAAWQAVAAHALAAFDLATGPMYRFAVFKLAPDEHIISRVLHHSVTDGWSAAQLNAELAADYAAVLRNEAPAAKATAMRYADFAGQQRALLDRNGYEQQLQYWEAQLHALPALDLPGDRPRPAEPSSDGDVVTVELSPEVVSNTRRMARDEGVSLFMVLATALACLLARYTGNADIAIGAATPGRTDPDLEGVVGYFTNMVVLRADLSGNPSFRTLLGRIADVTMDAFDNQDVPFERVVDRLQPVRDPGRNPLFGVCVQLLGDHNSGGSLELAGLRAIPVDPPVAGARFDLALNFVESPGRLRLAIEYSCDLFDRWRIEALADHLQRVLSGAIADPGLSVWQLPLMGQAERDQVLRAGCGQPLEYGDEPVHTVIACRAAQQPGHVAAVFEGQELTYADLDRRAGAVARFLRGQGLAHEEIVAVAMERDLDALVVLLGVLKAGAAYAILDPRLPAARLEYILDDTAARLILTQKRVRDRLPESPARTIVAVDDEWAAIESAALDRALPEWASRDSLAYVLYTSGSTGKPKGVLLDHRALRSFIESYRSIFGLVPQDRMLQLAALPFDMSHGEIFSGLSAGATLILVDPEAAASPDALSALMRSQRASYICMSPAMLALVDAGDYPDLRKIMAGGEAVPGEVVNKWNIPGRRLINVYGPTEAAVGCTSYECPHLHWRSAPPIGAPFPDRRMYAVDKSGNLLPRGVPGELLIGGEEGLARGYLNQPERTAASFTEDPFAPGGRVYRSGDLVRWNRDYQLEFIGRMDSQIKLRGLRIELEEIESALLAYEDVGMAAVALRPDPRGEQQLVGYVTPRGSSEPDPARLRRHLAEWLPDYMIPAVWMVMDRLPLTTARKVDRAALPAPVFAAGTDNFVPPTTPTEQQVAEIYAEVLELERVSAADSFFDIGGSSLQAMRVIGRITKSFGVKVKLRTMFSSSSVHALAATIDELRVASHDS